MKPIEIARKLDFVRMSGTDGEKKGREIILNYLKQLNIPYEIESFKHFSYQVGKAYLQCRDIDFPAVPFGINPDAKVKGELVFLENLNRIKHNRGAYEGKIVMSYRVGRGLMNRLKSEKIKGFIAVTPPYKKVTTSSHRQKLYEDSKYIPSITVSYNTAVELKKMAGEEVSIQIKQKVEKRKGYNIIANIPAKQMDKNIIYAMGHYDTVGRSPGACDNTGGCIALLKAAEYFSNHKPDRNIKIIFFSGEELGLLGSFDYVRQHKEEIKQYGGIVVNVDVSGDDIGQDIYRIIGNKNLLGYIDGISKENGLLFNSSLNIYSSDCMPFAVYEIPAVNIPVLVEKLPTIPILPMISLIILPVMVFKTL